MTNVIDMPQTGRRYDEASRWIAKLDRNLSAEDEQDLQRWMAADSENAAVVLSMARLWDKMDALSRLSDLCPWPACRRNPSRRFAGTIAAALALAVLAGAWMLIDPGPFDGNGDPQAAAQVWAGAYETAIGEQSTIALPDGSQLVLNTDSRISVNYDESHRLLTLERGEVNVRVAADKTRPLSAFAGDKIVQAIGTQFNIRMTDPQRIEVVVTEGEVRVGVREEAKQSGSVVEPVVLPVTSMTVGPHEQIILGSPDETITELSVDDIEVKLSWRHGNLIFRGESLEEAVREVGRYTSVEFVFLDDDLRQVRVAGLYRANDVDGLLAALQENFDVTYRRVDEHTVLLDSR